MGQDLCRELAGAGLLPIGRQRSRYSKVKNPAVGHYDLSLDAILHLPEELSV